MDSVKRYSELEETINVRSHGLALLMSVVALVLLVIRALRYGHAEHLVSAVIFGISLIALYAASTAYHVTQDPALRSRLRVVDHASIYVLIAGSYTPFTLITLQGQTGWMIFAICWSMAAVGIVLKLLFTGRFKLLSTSMYLIMGWMIVFAIEPLTDKLPHAGMVWLVSGGLSYTNGAALYTIGRIRLNHALFHVFVVIGSACHFVTVYLHVLPDG